MGVKTNRDFLKNSLYVGIIAILLLFSAIIPAATALKADQYESEETTECEVVEPEPPQTTEFNELINADTQLPDALQVVQSKHTPMLSRPFEPGKFRYHRLEKVDVPNVENAVPLVQPVTSFSEPMTDQPPESPARGPGGARANEDLEITNMEYTNVSSGWAFNYDDNTIPGNQAYMGSFAVGIMTTITVTVRNNGAATVNNVKVNLSIYDYTKLLYEGRFIPGMKAPTTKIITSIGASQTQQVTCDWTPPFASEFAITAEVDWPGDPDTTNNFAGYLSRVAIWFDDIESGAGSWSHNAPGGNTDDWHITTSPANQNHAGHSQTSAWYEGNADGPGATYPGDSYRDSNVCVLASPTLDLGNVRTMQYQGQYLIDYFCCYASLFTGKTESPPWANPPTADTTNSDVVYMKDISDNGGTSWEDMNMGGANIAGYFGDRYTSTVSGSMLYFSTGVWDTQWYPAPAYVTFDGASYYYNAGGVMNANVTSWDQIKFRIRFDDDSDGSTELGFYFDDFLIWGVQEYLPVNLVSIQNYSNPSIAGVPIITPNNQATFTTDVKNYGQAGINYVNLSVEDADTGTEVFSDSKLLNFQANEEKTQNWAWTPSSEGNYDLIITAGDKNLDWTPLDNEEKRRVYVRAPTTNILVVDDDNGMLSGGIFDVDIERPILDSLDALDEDNLTYNVYNVETNETGPADDIMDDYRVVIWLTGVDNQHSTHSWRRDYRNSYSRPDWDTTLKPLDVTEISNYLDISGKNLWLISPGLLYDNYGTSQTVIPSTHFPNEYLRISMCEANVTVKSATGQIITRGTPDPLVGMVNTLADSVSYPTYTTMPPTGFDDIGCIIDKVVTEDEALEILCQNSAQTKYNAISYNGDSYKSVYFGFNFYLIGASNDHEDLVERVMTFFGLLGSPSAEIVGDSDIYVNPDDEVSWQFKVVNGATLPDSYSLTLEHNNLDDWNPRLEVQGVETDQLQLSGSTSEDDIYLYATVPDLANAPAYFEADFGINLSSKLTGYKILLPVKATVNCIGNISITSEIMHYGLNVTEEYDFVIKIMNTTNGGDTYTVTLTLSGDGAALAYFSNYKNTIDIDLIANEEVNVIMRVKAGENDLAGLYSITAAVTHGTDELGALDFTAEVNQFYDLQLTTEDEDTVEVDPNEDSVSGEISLDFTFAVQNLGNGIDTVTMDASQDEDSPNTMKSEWLEFDLETVDVDAYNDANDPKYGEETVVLTVTMPTDIDTGDYVIKLLAISGDETGATEASTMITITLVKPDLDIEKIQFRRPDDSLINPATGNQKGFEISIEVVIVNLGEVDVTGIDARLEITHEDTSGTTVNDGTLMPTSSDPIDISALDNTTVTFKWTPLEEASYEIKASVDYDGNIIELDETNNELTETIKIFSGGKPGDDEPIGEDDDGDGMPNWWEDEMGTDRNVHDANGDPDEDDLTNIEEFWNATDPFDYDTDDDTLPDGWEAQYSPDLNPLVDDALQDPDLDMYTNIEEYNASTDPTDPNSYPGHHVTPDDEGKSSTGDNLLMWIIIMIVIIVVVIIVVIAVVIYKKKSKEYELAEEEYGMQSVPPSPPPPPPGQYPVQGEYVLVPEQVMQVPGTVEGGMQQPVYPPQGGAGAAGAYSPYAQQQQPQMGGQGMQMAPPPTAGVTPYQAAAVPPQVPAVPESQQLPPPSPQSAPTQIMEPDRLLPAPSEPPPQPTAETPTPPTPTPPQQPLQPTDQQQTQ